MSKKDAEALQKCFGSRVFEAAGQPFIRVQGLRTLTPAAQVVIFQKLKEMA